MHRLGCGWEWPPHVVPAPPPPPATDATWWMEYGRVTLPAAPRVSAPATRCWWDVTLGGPYQGRHRRIHTRLEWNRVRHSGSDQYFVAVLVVWRPPGLIGSLGSGMWIGNWGWKRNKPSSGGSWSPVLATPLVLFIRGGCLSASACCWHSTLAARQNKVCFEYSVRNSIGSDSDPF